MLGGLLAAACHPLSQHLANRCRCAPLLSCSSDSASASCRACTSASGAPHAAQHSPAQMWCCTPCSQTCREPWTVTKWAGGLQNMLPKEHLHCLEIQLKNRRRAYPLNMLVDHTRTRAIFTNSSSSNPAQISLQYQSQSKCIKCNR